ncbi:hypothetical protein I1A62_30130 [Rhodococcus sp. USK10]|uniref:hypothetical protein n=1 Tax=Rhodococcus sp. USK10 TaxID=2789739 RepID=UPI001C5E9D37|nr:hypothetical protein [Rhodococcus sp. USK10]QYB01488.1 hypothetical protein I1A62_30130 [Rhodococcus sp. USK10]
MRKTITAVAALGLLLMTGCSDDESGDNSAQACEDFARSQRELTNSLRDGRLDLNIHEVEAKRSAAVDSMDAAGLSTSNPDIKDRITDLVESAPTKTTELLLSKSQAEDFNRATESVARACASAGSVIIVNKIPIVRYMGP